MLLKYLDIQGFKAFPDKTRVTFDKGLTAVVGPNGSGKSNISDAIRWVMGEQSSKVLRVEKTEDLIFKGTVNRKSQGFAEVSLTMDNSNREFAIDNDEVTITRKYYRSGESEYMINRAVVRLKDINEIFMDTGLGKSGYSLIGQGKIAEIVQSRSDERRQIFEEAAGISKYRYRKNESERDLTRAEDNLSRLRDIVSELEGRVEPLKEQSEKAKRFLSLAEEKKTLEVSIWNNTLNNSNKLQKDQADKIIVCNNQLEEFEEKLLEIEQGIEAIFEKRRQYQAGVEEKRRQKSEMDAALSDLTAKIAVGENDIEHNEQNILRIDGEIATHSKAIEDTEADINAKNQAAEQLKRNLQELKAAIEQKQQELLSKTSESETHSQNQQELTDKMNRLILAQSQIDMQMAQYNSNISEWEATIARSDLEFKARTDELEKNSMEQESAKELMQKLNEKLDSLNNTYSGHKLKLDNRSEKFAAIKQEHEKLDLSIKEKSQKAKLLEGLENSLEGYNYSVKEVLKRAKNGALGGVLGTVSQVIEVKEEYSTAIEIALGGAMQNIIVENEGNAKAAIRLLQQNNLGRATFLPITSVKGTTMQVQGLERYAGYVNIASNLVKYDGKFKPIIESLLGRIVVVDDIDTAVLVAQKNDYKFRVVTLDGQVVNAGGSLTGGSKNKSQGILSRKNDIQALHSELEIARKKLSDISAQRDALQKETEKIEAELVAVTSEIATVNEDKIRLDAEQKRLNDIRTQLSNASEQMETELTTRKERLASDKTALATAAEEKAKLTVEISEVTELLEKLELTNKDAVESRTKLGAELSEMNIRTVELDKDIQAAYAAIEELKRQSKSSDARTSELYESKNALMAAKTDILAKIDGYRAEIEQAKEGMKSLNDELALISQRELEFDAENSKLRQQEREIAPKKEGLVAERSRLEAQLENIQTAHREIEDNLWNEYELSRTEAQKIAVEIESVPKANSQLNTVKNKIRHLGSVNVDAIEEYKEVSERYEFLSGQVKDAEKSRNELLRLIAELTQKMQDIFSENFNRINRNFKEVFIEMFGGGKAELRLTDPNNILDSGIEISAALPGKADVSLSSLSGGEQTIIAIAIYFAILKERPSPFCVLDEIEAALDDVNVVKYANYLRRISNKTQFVMITHRRGSMEAADVLYGVTMQEPGVSKMLRLDVAQAESSGLLKDMK